MRKKVLNLKGKLFTSIICSLLALAFAWPNFFEVKSSWLPSKGVNLGLDLRGGSHLLLNIDFKSYVKDQLNVITDSLRKKLREEKIGYKNLIVQGENILLEPRNLEDINAIKNVIFKLDRSINTEIRGQTMTLNLSASKLQELQSKVMDQSIEIIRMRIDSFGTKEPIIQRQGDDNILLQVPGEEDPQQLKNILGKTAKLTFHIVNDQASVEEALNGHVPKDSMLVKFDTHGQNSYLVVRKKIVVGGDQLNDAQASFDQNSQVVVSFSFNNIGGKLFAEATKENIGKRLAIVLDDKILCAPSISVPILGGSGIIQGSFTVELANELALLLRAGALPAPLKVIEERTIGPNLGADSISDGKKAGLIGAFGVAIFMVWSYGILGIFADIALAFALLYILGLLSAFQATLTLPGIAGIILTMGMAVDANVLIYERIKEELKSGASNLYAIRQGFDSAFATIADSNITTLIAALMLYIFGVGAVKGFAVTLSIGILSSMFAAIIITKLLIDLWMKYYKPKSLGLGV